MPKPLPTNTATFRKIVEGGLLYIDKTEHIYRLVHRATGAYFFSRPRRFGKSLFLSTLEELFKGNRDLFQGLWIAINLLHQQNFDVHELDHLEVGELAFSTYDIGRLSVIPLLFQTGYLTIKGYDSESRRYTLSYPNEEVENAFLTYLLDAFSYQQQALSEANVFDSGVGQVGEWKIVVPE